MQVNGEPPARLFTVEEANALLPTLQALLAQVVDAHQRFLRTMRELDSLERRRDRANVMQMARPLREARERLGADHEALRVAFERVTDQGVQIKNIEPPLLDFPAWRDGRIVLLCWRDGEPAVAHWHDLDAGFAGRQPI